MSRRRVLARLDEELRTLAAFDRLHELTTNHDSAEINAYAARQNRRLQITAEIAKLEASRRNSLVNQIRVSSGFAILCALGYASLRYLFR